MPDENLGDLLDDPEYKLRGRGGRSPGTGGPGPGGGFGGGGGGSFYGGGGPAYNPVSSVGMRKRRLPGAPLGGVQSFFGDAAGGGDGASLPGLATMAPASTGMSVTGGRMASDRGVASPMAAVRPTEEPMPATPSGGSTTGSAPSTGPVPDYAAILRLPSAGGIAAAAREWATTNGLGSAIGGWAARDGWDTVNRELVKMVQNGTLHTQLAGMRDATANGDLNGSDRNDPTGIVMRLLGDAIKSGVLSPNGSPALQESLRGEAQRNADSIRNRTALRGRLSGADAGSMGTASLLADLQGSDAGSDLLNAQSVDRQQRFASLVSGLLGASYGQQNTQDNARFMQALQKLQNGDNSGLMGLLGDAGGAALTSLFASSGL